MRTTKVNVTTDTVTLVVESTTGEVLFQKDIPCLLRKSANGCVGVWKLFPFANRKWTVFRNTRDTPVEISSVYLVSRTITENLGMSPKMHLPKEASTVIIQPDDTLHVQFTGEYLARME